MAEGGIEARPRYCYSIPGILAWLEIIFALIVLLLLVIEGAKYGSAFILLHDGEHYTCFVCVFTMVVTFIFLVAFFLNCHNGMCSSLPCVTIMVLYFVLAVLMWIAAAGVEIWATTDFDTLRKLTERSGYADYYQELFDRRCAASAFCIVEVILNAISLYFAHFKREVV